MSKQAWRARLPKLMMGAVLLLVLAGMFFVIKGFIDSAEKPSKSKVQIISLVKPPEPKPPEQKPPEPEKQEIKEEVQVDQPNPEPADSPPEGLTSSLGPGADGGFGLAAGDGKGTGRIGGGGNVFNWYASLLQQALQEQLAASEKAKNVAYKVLVKVWVSTSGKVERYEVMNSSGNSEVDVTLRAILSSLRELKEAPPPDMPQPLKLRIVSR
ncbi:MAG: energy transducer TonB [Hydrogenophilales bacterium]|nr:energy transducer TonB [Hydrogenophilales bacterium]